MTCDFPPIISKTAVSMPKNFSLGATVIYTCLPNNVTGKIRRFRDGYLRKNISCTIFGTWSDYTLRCYGLYIYKVIFAYFVGVHFTEIITLEKFVMNMFFLYHCIITLVMCCESIFKFCRKCV